MADRINHEKWFREADRNGDGYLSQKELKKALKVNGYSQSRKQFKEMFKQMDINNDNKISLHEFLFFMRAVPEAYHNEALLRQAFEKADRDRDGFLTIPELNHALRDLKHDLSNPNEIFKIVSAMDKDKNGKIDYGEFLNYFMSQRGLSD